MADDALEVVALRNSFYRDSYRRVVLALLVSIVVIVMLVGAIFYELANPPAPKYFATTVNGRITPLVSLNEPNMAKSAILQWAQQAAIAAYTFNFVNYRQELQAASNFFTPSGWQAFVKALNDSGNLTSVIQKKLVVSAVATGAPVILQEGLLNNVYAWRIQMPVLVTYQSSSQITQQRITVTMLITRLSTLNAPKGIGIAQFVVTGS